MPSSTILEERPLNLVELKTELDKIEKRDKELNFRATKTKDYLKNFAKLDKKKVVELRKKIQELDIPRIKERQIAKVIDMLPEDMDDLRTVFVGETTTISPENMQKILDTVKKHA